MNTMNEIKDFIITREFEAPRNLVWKTWTDKEHLSKWMSPVGFDMSFKKFEFKVGGEILFSQSSSDGIVMWAKWDIREIEINKKLVMLITVSDKNGHPSIHSMVSTWPQKMLATTTFNEKNGNTIVNLKWTPYEADEEALATFNGSLEGMSQAWSETFTVLESYLDSI